MTLWHEGLPMQGESADKLASLARARQCVILRITLECTQTVMKLLAKTVVKIIEMILRGISKLSRQEPADRSVALTTFLQCQSACEGVDPTRVAAGRLLVVVPFRDAWHLTDKCIQSILRQELGSELKVHIILVDNNSTEITTRNGLEKLLAATPPPGFTCSLHTDPRPFNFSQLNNDAVESMPFFDWILFANNDLELETPTMVQECASFLSNHPKVGAVGCTLLYPDRTVQHLFLCPGVRILAAHPGKGWLWNPTQFWYREPRHVPAITGAFLMARAADFRSVGGFEEALPRAGQDLDLCLKLEEMGLKNFTLPHLVAIHYETATRDPKIPKDDVAYMYKKWGNRISHHPLVSRRMSRWSEEPVRSLGEGDFPWHWVL